MSTVVQPDFRSTPGRDAYETWTAIVDLLTKGLLVQRKSFSPSAASRPASSPTRPARNSIVVTCDGPRTRIYCLYDDDAIDGADANEDALGYDPLKGDWRVSLPA